GGGFVHMQYREWKGAGVDGYQRCLRRRGVEGRSSGKAIGNGRGGEEFPTGASIVEIYRNAGDSVAVLVRHLHYKSSGQVSSDSRTLIISFQGHNPLRRRRRPGLSQGCA